MKKRKFAIADIHGCFTTYKALLEKIEFSKHDELYLLGDYVDRGPNSKQLIDDIIRLQEEGYEIRCLLGNHEIMMLNSLNDAEAMGFWFRNGGEATLASFQVKSTKEIPEKYINWLNSLSHYFEVDEYILVHAGLNFRRIDPLEDLESMLWIRRWYPEIDHRWLGERIIIHGHTPTDFSFISAYSIDLEQNRHLVIDGGCVYKNRGLGDLVAFELGKRELFVQQNVE